MSLGDAWGRSIALRWLLSLAAGLILAAAVGIWAVFGQVNHMNGQLDTFIEAAKIDHARYDRYLERSSGQ